MTFRFPLINTEEYISFAQSLSSKQGSVRGVEMFKTIDGDLCFCKQNNDLFMVFFFVRLSK